MVENALNGDYYCTVNRLTMDLSLERCGCDLKTTLLCKYICAYFYLSEKYWFFLDRLMDNLFDLSIFVNIFEIYLVIQSLWIPHF